MTDVRKTTNKIYEALEEGLLTHEQVVKACLCYMSEWEVDDMASYNDFYLGDEDESDEDEGDEDESDEDDNQ
jgi:hypothetical protein